jgi:phage baseplate assembly protein W
MAIGLTMPFAQTTSSLGYLAFSTKDTEATLHNMKSLVLTNWGERLGHYYLGCNLIEYLFNQETDETQEKIIQRIESQVASWLPYVNIESLQVSFVGQEEHGIRVQITFNIKGRQDLNSVLDVTVESSAET